MTGVVKFYNESKGIGFISQDDGGRDIFVHASFLVDQIRDGDKVQFEVENGKRGLNAIRVRRIG